MGVKNRKNQDIYELPSESFYFITIKELLQNVQLTKVPFEFLIYPNNETLIRELKERVNEDISTKVLVYRAESVKEELLKGHYDLIILPNFIKNENKLIKLSKDSNFYIIEFYPLIHLESKNFNVNTKGIYFARML